MQLACSSAICYSSAAHCIFRLQAHTEDLLLGLWFACSNFGTCYLLGRTFAFVLDLVLMAPPALLQKGWQIRVTPSPAHDDQVLQRLKSAV